MNKYQWQGEPVKVEFGEVLVTENKDKPLFWYNFECYYRLNLNDEYEYIYCSSNKRIGICDAVKVIHSTGEFIIANHFGIGVHKLLNGGWPNYQHFSLNGDFQATSWKEHLHLKKFDELGFSKHEAARRNWQKQTYPIEFEKMKNLRSVIRNNLKFT